MVSSKSGSKPAGYQSVRNRKKPTTDYENSSRTGEIIESNDRGNIEVMTAKEVAGLLQVSTWSVYELVKCGEIPHFKVGRSVRFVRGEVVGWMLG